MDFATPESMQVEPTSNPSTAYAGASSSNDGSTSGAQPASYDAAVMAYPTARRPQRNHADAPVRKLGVNLIDTYKLINQVCVANACIPTLSCCMRRLGAMIKRTVVFGVC